MTSIRRRVTDLDKRVERLEDQPTRTWQSYAPPTRTPALVPGSTLGISDVGVVLHYPALYLDGALLWKGAAPCPDDDHATRAAGAHLRETLKTLLGGKS